MTSNDPEVKPKKNKVKGDAKIEINDRYLDEILQNNNLIKVISNDQTVRSNTVPDL